MTLLRLKAKDVEGQRSHFHRWSMWEPECEAGLAVTNGFSLITELFSGLEVGGKQTQTCEFAFWIPPTRKQLQTTRSGDEVLALFVMQG